MADSLEGLCRWLDHDGPQASTETALFHFLPSDNSKTFDLGTDFTVEVYIGKAICSIFHCSQGHDLP